MNSIYLVGVIMTVEEPVKKLILVYLAKWKTTRVNKDRFDILKEEMMKEFGYTTLPLTTIKKWVRATIKETKQAEKLKQIRYSPSPIAAPTAARAFQQALAFDLIAMKKTVEKTLDQLSTIKSGMDKNKVYVRTAAPEIAAIRKTYERISARLSEIEKKVVVKE